MSVDSVRDIYDDLCKKYQRELNRLQDTDRNTRKRGIMKLYEDIPWDSYVNGSSSSSAVVSLDYQAFVMFLENQLVLNQVLVNIITNDSLEKCREVGLKMFDKCALVCDINVSTWSDNIDASKSECLASTVQKLCARITSAVVATSLTESSSFPEPSEELRHHIVRILSALVKGKEDSALRSYSESSTFPSSVASVIVTGLSKALLDQFPEVKRDSADLLCVIAILSPMTIRLNFKTLLKGLCANASHQHSKTRSITLKVCLDRLPIVISYEYFLLSF
jgi:hypothetical protein